MKYRYLTVEHIMTLDEEALLEAQWRVASVSTGVKKALKKIERLPVETDRHGKLLAEARDQVAKANALNEAIMCREDELYGPGVMSSYDHTQRFC